jgi:tetratricopeptide (TPR) repeat protein
VAAELARQQGRLTVATERTRHAASLEPANLDLVILWATDAFKANQPTEAARALATLAPEVTTRSAYAQRLLGELARTRGELTAARDHFTAALALDGPLPLNEIPLGLILLSARDATERTRGIALLTRWTPDPTWGPVALRPLLADATRRADNPATLRYAEALLVHPRHTVADMPEALRALASVDRPRFSAVLTELEKAHAATPAAAAQLIDWLNKIGEAPEAVRWAATLPASAAPYPPLLVTTAEAMRLASAWPALSAWTHTGHWGTDYEFLHWAYGMEAARQLGDTTHHDELWRTLQAYAAGNGVHAYFAGNALYTWGRYDEALTLLWLAAERPEVSVQALGTLARHYQTQRDAAGQYRVFKRLHSITPQDPAIINNLAFFAALTGQNPNLAETLAAKNLAAAPTDVARAATYAFTLVVQRRPAEALAVLQPFLPPVATTTPSPALTLAQGLALAATGQKSAARLILQKLSASADQTREEAALIARAIE